MDCEHKLKVLEQEIESLKEENRLLKEKLSSSEKNFDGVSFKEKYAVRILDSLPDMLTVFNHEEMGIEVVSNEETNHVGVSNNDFKGMRMQDMVPPEAYQNIHFACLMHLKLFQLKNEYLVYLSMVMKKLYVNALINISKPLRPNIT